MAFSEQLAGRIRTALRRRKGLTERRMFGGVAFMVHGHMACGVIDDMLVLRLGDDGADEALAEPYTRPMDFTGKPLRSMIYVDPAGTRTDAALKAWIDRGLKYVRTLPPKD